MFPSSFWFFVLVLPVANVKLALAWMANVRSLTNAMTIPSVPLTVSFTIQNQNDIVSIISSFWLGLACDEATGTCTFTNQCNIGECMISTCNPAVGCSHTPRVCNDNILQFSFF